MIRARIECMETRVRESRSSEDLDRRLKELQRRVNEADLQRQAALERANEVQKRLRKAVRS